MSMLVLWNCETIQKDKDVPASFGFGERKYVLFNCMLYKDHYFNDYKVKFCNLTIP